MFGGLPHWQQIPDIGLYMDQVLTLTERTFAGVLPGGEITRSMVNNYVKSGLLPRPAGKKYDREHLALLIMIAVLKQALSMEEIAALFEYLCADGVRGGYEQFLAEVEGLRTAASSGRIDLWLDRADERRQALRAGVIAAICTIFARDMIKQAKMGKI